MPIKLAIFDVDGTLLRGDTACQTIARGLGKYERMCELEGVEGRDQVAAGRNEMAGWYLEAGKSNVETHLSNLMWAPGAREGIAELHVAGVQIALASMTWSFIVEHIANELSVARIHATELDFRSGSVTHSWIATKADFLRLTASESGIPISEVAAVGDSKGDYDMLRAARLPIYVGNGPIELNNITHLPDADIRDVSRTILTLEK